MSTRKQFRSLVARPGLLTLPGAYDALSARIIVAQGFEAIVAGGYAAIGSLLGEPDMGQSNMRDYADHYGRISMAVDVPVYVDADTGFGGVHNVRQAVRAFEAAGVAGLFINEPFMPPTMNGRPTPGASSGSSAPRAWPWSASSSTRRSFPAGAPCGASSPTAPLVLASQPRRFEHATRQAKSA